MKDPRQRPEISFIRFTRERFRASMEEVYKITMFGLRFFRYVFRPPYEFAEVRKHLDNLGSKSIPLLTIVGLIMGLILALQSRPTLDRFGAGGFLPAMISLTIVRELGPVITALIVAGRVSSGIGAEVGSMRVTEQIDALEVSAVDPYNFLVVTRVLACMIILPLLTAYVDFLAIFGGFLAEYINGNSSFMLYFTEVVQSLQFYDILPGVGKTIAFGYIIGVIGAYQGFNTSRGTEGVGRAATSAVVLASLNIIFLDMVIIQLTFLFLGPGV
ncbi:MAG: ABC transporter permease [Bacteroidetes bacterium]|nr:ABC transporter permease [Bacteroidota bacterium]